MTCDWHLLTLAQRPAWRPAVTQLIEDAFKYQAPYHFAEDFYPLLAPENAAHNYLILQGDTLIGHIGIRLVDLAYGAQQVPAAFLGGLAMRQDYRGKGIFKAALAHVLQLYEQQVGLFVLWSDQAELYAKFNFWQAGLVLQLGEGGDPAAALLRDGWRKYIPRDFSDPLGRQIPPLYHAWAQEFIFVKRTISDWKMLAKITSAYFLVHPAERENANPQEAKIDAYCVIGKGFDLGHVIHEIGGQPTQLAPWVRHMQNYKLWLPGSTLWQQRYPEAKPLYTGLLRRGNFTLLEPFLKILAPEKQKDLKQIYQDQEDQLFWQSLFGPGENTLLPPLYISGLDSI
ncbi:MAG: GNAT family N-acetyltransferase [Bacteriovoracaceae bacterium]|nr:GNAT family N-acetyltransferase [Bacteriovoracaceae bacterium]